MIRIFSQPYSTSKCDNKAYRCLKNAAITKICDAYKDLTKGNILDPKLLSYDCFLKPNSEFVCPTDEYSTLACTYTNEVTGQLRQFEFRMNEKQWRVSTVIDKIANNGELIKKYNKYGDMYSVMYQEPRPSGNGHNLFEFAIDKYGNAQLTWKHY